MAQNSLLVPKLNFSSTIPSSNGQKLQKFSLVVYLSPLIGLIGGIIVVLTVLYICVTCSCERKSKQYLPVTTSESRREKYYASLEKKKGNNVGKRLSLNGQPIIRLHNKQHHYSLKKKYRIPLITVRSAPNLKIYMTRECGHDTGNCSVELATRSRPQSQVSYSTHSALSSGWSDNDSNYNQPQASNGNPANTLSLDANQVCINVVGNTENSRSLQDIELCQSPIPRLIVSATPSCDFNQLPSEFGEGNTKHSEKTTASHLERSRHEVSTQTADVSDVCVHKIRQLSEKILSHRCCSNTAVGDAPYDPPPEKLTVV